MSGTKVRNVCWTLNNYTEEDEISIQRIECKYLVYGREIGAQGTKHLQGYIEFENPRSFRNVAKLLKNSHIEKRKGTAKQASDYCKKDGDYFEKGSISEQGKRNDLVELRDTLIQGKRLELLIMEQPMSYHQYGRTLHKIEDLVMRGKVRTVMTKGIWYWGGTGTGKSHKAFEGFTPESHYVVPNDNGWWDAYVQQRVVIINDFRGEISYNEMLQLVDKWPHWVKRRNREPMPFTSELVIVTSSLAPDQVYHRRCEEDSISQLLRRFEVIRMEHTNGTEVV